MSTAILISGQLRTFAQCYPTQRWHLYRHFPNPHFFITVQDEPALSDKLKALRSDFGEDRVHVESFEDPKLGFSPDIEEMIRKGYEEAPYQNAAPIGQLLQQHWWQSRCYLSYRSHPSHESHQFDTIIRIRPDQFFHSFDQPEFEYGEVLGSRRWPGPHEAFTPWWGRFGGVNDRLAILGRDAARAYFTVYEQIPALLAKGCPFHPESLVKAALLENGCTIHETLRTEFTTLRLDGNHRPPEIMSCDVAHAALRAA